MFNNNNNRIRGIMDYVAVWELAPTDPLMQRIRMEYFNATGHYGSDNEVKAWYMGDDNINTPHSQPEVKPSA